MSEEIRNIQDRINDLERKISSIMEILDSRKSESYKRPIDRQPIEEKTKTQDRNEIQLSIKSKGTTHSVTPKSSNLLPILAVICFGMAGIFIVRLAIESGWLTPERQWGLLVLFGISLSGIGLFLNKFDINYRSYAGAAGVLVLYLASYGSFLYFNLFSTEIAQVFGVVISVFCFYLFHYFKSELFVVICTIGTYISPVLLNKKSDLIFISGFFLIWAGLFSRIAIFLRSRSLVLLASYLGLGVFTFLNSNNNNIDELPIIILVLFIQFITYAGGVYYFSIINKDPLSNKEAMAYLPILLFFYGTTYFFLNKLNPLFAPWISLGFASFIYFLYWKAKESIQSLESHNLVQSFFAVVLFHSGYLGLLPVVSRPWLLPLLILGTYVAQRKDIFKFVGSALHIAFFAMGVIEFLSLCFRLLTDVKLFDVVPALATILMGFIYYSKYSEKLKNKESLFLGLVHVLCILSLYRIAFEYGSLAVSLVWGIYSLGILIFGYVKKNGVVAKSSLIVLTVTCVKALAYDASQNSSGVRIACLIFTGVVLYGSGYLFQEINKWKKVDEK